MKHPSSRAFFTYWDEQRGAERAPERSDLDPGPIRALLGDSFILAGNQAEGFSFRVTGTRVCALFGREMKGESLKSLVAPHHRGDIDEILSGVTEELLVAVAGLKGRASQGSDVALELLLLPFSPRAHSPVSLAGLLAPLAPCEGLLSELELSSFRFQAHPPQKFRPRMLRKWQAACGLMVYEGLS